MDGKVVVITGASGGLGERFAVMLHRAGANVVLAARRRERIAEVAERLGERALPVECDVTLATDRERLIKAVHGYFGLIDVLVNNAGIARPAPAEAETLSDWSAVLEVNLTSVFALTQLISKDMLECGAGSIINVSSILGMVASTPFRQASYCATKGAVIQMTRELACQWADRGVRVNCLAPGYFLTEMTEELLLGSESACRYIVRNCPMGRIGNVGELDGALLFLASDMSTYCTGQTIVIDGGWTAR
jgi:NAD(P)-dependent dehydrogenase (short-subunit alcohol dehydrogenase family)